MNSMTTMPKLLLGLTISVASAALVHAEPAPSTAVEAATAESTNAAASRTTQGRRLVGTWRNQISISPCNGGPPATVIGYNTYHEGGTLTEFNLQPPATRSIGSGQWRAYGGGIFDVHFQFARFTATGAFDGMQDIQAALEVDARGRRSTGTVRAKVLNPDGSVRVELCGTLQGERLNLLAN